MLLFAPPDTIFSMQGVSTEGTVDKLLSLSDYFVVRRTKTYTTVASHSRTVFVVTPETAGEQVARLERQKRRADAQAAAEAMRQEAIETARAKHLAEKEAVRKAAAERARRYRDEEERLAPIRAEQEAERKLKLVQDLIEVSDLSDHRVRTRVRTRLEEIIKDYGSTKAAAEARELLKKINA